VVSEAPQSAAGDAGIVETVELDEIAAALFGDGQGCDDGVVAIGDQVAAELPDTGEVGVIKDYDATGFEKSIDVKEVDQSGIESMPTVDEGEVGAKAFSDELREGKLGGRVAEVDEVGVAGAFEAVEAGALESFVVGVDFVGQVLVRIDDDVACSGLGGENFTDEKGRNAVGEADFDADLGFDLGDEALKEEALFDGDVGVDGEFCAGFGNGGSGADDFVKDGVHGVAAASCELRWGTKQL